ncbi:MAG: STAS domain-containing protein [Parvibaculales bacterium]
MPFHFKKHENQLKLILTGDIDLEITPDIKLQLIEYIEESSSFDIDGAQVSYIDSSGVSLLVIAMQSCAKNDIPFTISRLSEQLLRVVELAHLEKLLPIGENTGPADVEDITDFDSGSFDDAEILKDIGTKSSPPESPSEMPSAPQEEETSPLDEGETDADLIADMKKDSDNEIISDTEPTEGETETPAFKPGTF